MKFEFIVGTRWDAKRLSNRLAKRGISSDLRPSANGEFAVSGATDQPKVESVGHGLRIIDFKEDE